MDQAPTSSSEIDLFIFAGELSGDVLGAELIHSLIALKPNLKIAAVSGPQMRRHAITTILPMEKFNVMGFLDVFKMLPRLIKNFFYIKKYLLQTTPKACVFIDYQEFSLQMTKALKKKGFQNPLIQYVCPSVWAWKKGRIKPMSKSLNLLLCLFPFEPICFENTPLKAKFIGHPLSKKKSDDCEVLPLYEKPILSIFPGSRKQEILKNLPLQLECAVESGYENYAIVISCAHPKLLPLIEKERLKYPLHQIYIEKNKKLIENSRVAIATSGTVTLELAFAKIPTVVTYSISPIDCFLAKQVLKINLPHYCIANYTANTRIFPELYGPSFNKQNLKSALESLLFSKEEYDLCSSRCDLVRTALDRPDPSLEAAKLVIEEALL